MCTVTLIAASGTDFILTSNRDEAEGRKTIPPKKYQENNVTLLYPKDAVAGGTWIGLSERKRLICLLNGGFDAHERKENYRKSRGIVVTDLLKTNNFNEEICNYNLIGIEPFTLIVVEWQQGLRFMEFVWDGNEEHRKELPLKNHLWSSSPLYSSEMKKLREAWFSEFQKKTKKPSKEEVWNFHHSGGHGDKNVDLIMDREFVKTKSITQVVKAGDGVEMIYEDLLLKEIQKFPF